jgi:hypothetical protein
MDGRPNEYWVGLTGRQLTRDYPRLLGNLVSTFFQSEFSEEVTVLNPKSFRFPNLGCAHHAQIEM